MPLVIIADDLAGACDTAAEFCGRGRATVLVMSGLPGEAALGAEGEVAAIDTESRSLGRDHAARRVRETAGRLGPRLAADVVFKKTDSTLRGWVGAELDALLGVTERAAALVCPAFPQQRRTVTEGVLKVAGIPVHATPIGRDPDYPGATSDIVEILAAQTQRPLRRLPLERVRRGAEAVASSLEGDAIVVADAETDADLAALARAALARPGMVLAGSAGLARAVAAELGLAGPPPVLPRGRSWLVVAGSLHPASRAQIEALAAAGARVCRIDGDAGTDTRPIVEALRAGRPGVISSPDAVEGRRERMAGRLAAVAARVLADVVPALTCVTGGSTAHALIAALGADRLEICGAPRSGLALGELVVDSTGRRVPILTKAGGFGPPELFVSLQEDTLP